jgi:hypothetical protein
MSQHQFCYRSIICHLHLFHIRSSPASNITSTNTNTS